MSIYASFRHAATPRRLPPHTPPGHFRYAFRLRFAYYACHAEDAGYATLMPLLMLLRCRAADATRQDAMLMLHALIYADAAPDMIC